MRGKCKIVSRWGSVVVDKHLQQLTQSVTHFVKRGERIGKNRYPGRATQTWHELRVVMVGRSSRRRCRGESQGYVIGEKLEGGSVEDELGGGAVGEVLGGC
jgi:hypothetical protein